MGIENKDFFELVGDAKSGKLRLPQFQRDFKWQSPKVLRLFNSIRKGFPIGGFLTLEASRELDLYARSFYGVGDPPNEALKHYVLDGQQRITAGLALCHGIGLGKHGETHYFLNLKKLWDRAKDLDYDNDSCVEKFAEDLDDEDGYVVYRRTPHPDHELENREYLHTHALADYDRFDDAKNRYLAKHPDQPERVLFMNKLVRRFFGIAELAPRDRGILVPVTELDSEMPVTAITTVFETMNTTGQQLTPVEIVTAILFGAEPSIHLRDEIDSYKNQKTYYRNLDATGEVFLQTIALLSGKNPKKKELPGTIKSDNYRKHQDASVEALDLAGKFLSERFYMWIDANAGLVPYPAILSPLGIALTRINQIHSDVSDERAEWYKRLDRWFVGSIFEQRYRDSQPATQQSDVTDLVNWISKGEEPGWMSRASIPVLDEVAPKSATGKLITCLINKQEPKDPMDGETPVGGKDTKINSVHSHHTFPRGFCKDYISDWHETDDDNLALNIMPITNDTNQEWGDKNPADHVGQVLDASGGSEEELYRRYAPFFIDELCLKILRKPNKMRDDFRSFIEHRGKLIQDHVASEYNFPKDTSIDAREQAGNDEED